MKEAGDRSTDPEIAKAKCLKPGKDSQTVMLKFRLFSGDDPCSKVVDTTSMEANAWNRNAAAFYHWQNTLGRDCLPILVWKQERDGAKAKIYIVRYKENGAEKSAQIVAQSKAEARREFDAVASVVARITDVEEREADDE